MDSETITGDRQAWVLTAGKDLSEVDFAVEVGGTVLGAVDTSAKTSAFACALSVAHASCYVGWSATHDLCGSPAL